MIRSYATISETMKGLEEIRSALGADAVSVDQDDLEQHGFSEWSTSNTSIRPRAVVRPTTTREVSIVAKICSKYKIPMVPFGAGSSVEGNFSSPFSGICIDLSGMNRIIAFHPDDMDIVVEAGVNWMLLNEQIQDSGLFLPLDPSPTAQIGGMIATNCSGTNAMRYGTMKDYVLSLTIVLADVKEAAAAASRMIRKGINLAALELMDELQMKVVNLSGGTCGKKWEELPTLFIKFSGTNQAIEDSVSAAKEVASSIGCRSFASATTQEEMADLWSARKQALWACLAARPEGTQIWSTDVAVPISRLADIIDDCKASSARLGLFSSVLGHVGDGNFHQMIMYNPNKPDEAAAVKEFVDDMTRKAVKMEGTVSNTHQTFQGEHGIGLGKKHCLLEELGPLTIGVMKSLKESIDPESARRRRPSRLTGRPSLLEDGDSGGNTAHMPAAAFVRSPASDQQPQQPSTTSFFERQHINSRRYSHHEDASTGDTSQISPAESIPLSSSKNTARSRIISTQLHNTADALDLLTFTAADEQGRTSHQAAAAVRNNSAGSTINAQNPTSANVAPLPTSNVWTFGQFERSDAGWDQFVLIKRGIITKNEIQEYLGFYFKTLWAVRPVVHPFYCDPSHHVQLAIEEPLLLVSLITLSSRYHVLAGSYGEIRSERIHWQAWKSLQHYLQSALWGSPHTRSPGAIAAMLLMIEWHAKSINNPAAFSEDEEGGYGLNGPSDTQRTSWNDKQPDSAMTSLTSQQRYGMATLLESLNIVAPAYRSNKTSWMLLSNAIALAQEGCCFESDQHGVSSTSELPSPVGSRKETFKKQWNQLICVFIYLADEHLAMRLGLNPLLAEEPNRMVRKRFSTTFASLLPNSAVWESYFDLFTEVRKARLLLQSLKRNWRPTWADADNLHELEHLDRALSRWKRQHLCVQSTESSLLDACFNLEYHYTVMYSFAPASYVLQHSNNSSGENLDTQRTEALSRLANQALQASHQILSILINTLGPAGLTRFLPTALILNPNISESDDKVRLLRSSITAIRQGSPDDTHMAVRYARFLEILLNASLHSSRAESPATTGPEDAIPDTSGELGASGTDDQEFSWASCLAPATSSLDNWASLDLSNGLGNPGDPFQWWDGTFGVTGIVGMH
ncbi:d-lactate dehydrogenase [Paramyrothecium foliicola]|nr:d-lactate dehydrogenase [Paramyrothecium foliicola]